MTYISTLAREQNTSFQMLKRFCAKKILVRLPSQAQIVARQEFIL